MRLPPKPRFQRLLHHSLICGAHDFPDKPVLIAQQHSVSYRRLLGHVQACAAALAVRGIARGDRVAIYAENTLECVVGLWATLWAGAAFVVINPQTKSDKLRYILNKSGAKLLIADNQLQPEWGKILSQCAALDGILVSNLKPEDRRPSNEPAIEDFWSAVNAEAPMEAPVFAIPLDIAALIFTSGSTGTPKGVTMTHQSMVFARDSITEYLRLSEEDVIINVLPLAFDYGLYQLLLTISLGATLVLERSFTFPSAVFESVRRHDVTVFPAVPTIYSTLISLDQKQPLCFPSVRRITNTAAALPPDYIPPLRRIFPNALIFAMYGLTECKRVSYLEPELIETKRGSVGKAIPGTEMFLLSPAGEPVLPGQTGILHIRGPHVMQGYWNDPEQTAKMLKPGRFPGEPMLCAQDWFSMDKDGFFYFKGRSDDIIKSRGEKVSPIEVENVLYGLKGIKEAAVIGVPDQALGQAIKAFVVLEPQSALSANEIQRHCAAHLENFMVPQLIEFLAALPKTDTGKIKKDTLH